ncbi:hypothetical protein [Mycobacterium marinum]|uniref:hypothetical protein n=1 Tax=Mycobacterium marinum TaxID=1781 RepID=UPI001140746B|nr:hypothetical protein [Mycobacterium marinum]
MTAEAIVMNRSAVALAADSAVTIGRPGRTKTFETANKLFELVKGSNVGIMIYSAASINGTPWETIIKTYRQEHSHFTADHVEDYAEHFLDFVSEHTGLLTLEDEVLTVMFQLSEQLDRNVLQLLLRWPDSLISASSGRIVQTRVRRALDDIISFWADEIDKSEDIQVPKEKRQ